MSQAIRSSRWFFHSVPQLLTLGDKTDFHISRHKLWQHTRTPCESPQTVATCIKVWYVSTICGDLWESLVFCQGSAFEGHCGKNGSWNKKVLWKTLNKFSAWSLSILLCQIGNIGHAKGGHHYSHQISQSCVTYKFKGHTQTIIVSKVETGNIIIQ
jgi:hypothetical protein